MPSIPRSERVRFDKHIDALIREGLCGGSLNYIITRLLISHCTPASYPAIEQCMGVLACASAEFYRRVAAPYEDKKRKQNGDVF